MRQLLSLLLLAGVRRSQKEKRITVQGTRGDKGIGGLYTHWACVTTWWDTKTMRHGLIHTTIAIEIN